MSKKMFSLLGISKRANKLVSGESLVLHEIRTKRASLVIMANDVAHNLEKKVKDKCYTYNVPLIRYGTREQLGKAIGKEERVVLGITDQGLAKILMETSLKN